MTKHNNPTKRRRVLVDAITVALVVVLGTAYGAGAADKRRGESDNKEKRKRVPESRQLEARGGFKLRGVELIADGGLVLMRYTVLDPDKVEKIKSDEGTGEGPKIENQKDTKTLVPSGGMRHDHKLRAGQSDFTMYQNTDGAVKKGDKISITIQGVTITDVPVE
jgi:hypothetical protein